MNSLFYYYAKAYNWRRFWDELLFYLRMRMDGRPHQKVQIGNGFGRRWGFWTRAQAEEVYRQYWPHRGIPAGVLITTVLPE